MMVREPKSNAQTGEARGIQSVEIGARLLNVLAASPCPMKLKDLAIESDLVPAQAHPYLVSFRQMGLVEQTPSGGAYRLGPFAVDLGMARMRTSDPHEVARESLRELADETGQTCLLAVWGALGPTIIQVTDGPTQVHMTSRVGTVYSLSGTASGRVFSAFLPEAQTRDVAAMERRKSELQLRVGVPQPMSKAELSEIRSSGLSRLKQPIVPGLNAFAAPVFDYSGELAFVIALTGREDFFAGEQGDKMGQILMTHTQKLSSELGFIPDDPI